MKMLISTDKNYFIPMREEYSEYDLIVWYNVKEENFYIHKAPSDFYKEFGSTIIEKKSNYGIFPEESLKNYIEKKLLEMV